MPGLSLQAGPRSCTGHLRASFRGLARIRSVWIAGTKPRRHPQTASACEQSPWRSPAQLPGQCFPSSLLGFSRDRGPRPRPMRGDGVEHCARSLGHAALSLENHRLEAYSSGRAFCSSVLASAFVGIVRLDSGTWFSKGLVPMACPQRVDDGTVQSDTRKPAGPATIWKPLGQHSGRAHQYVCRSASRLRAWQTPQDTRSLKLGLKETLLQ